MFYVCLTIFAAAIVAVDQWTKALAAAQLTDCVDVIIPGWLELRYLLVQAALAGVTAWFRLGLVGFGAAVGVLIFYLAVINPRYMGRKLWWGRPRRRS